jgi:hypothetical protein
MVTYGVLVLSIISAFILGGVFGIFLLALMMAARDEDRSESESDCE